MNRITLAIIAALTIALAGLGYFAYKQTQANGVISQQLSDKNTEYDALSAAYEETRRNLNDRQMRLDANLQANEQAKAKAASDSKLFRTEIDKLKATNNAYKQLLESRIPDALLNRLCLKGYASPTVCEGLLPSTGILPARLPVDTVGGSDSRGFLDVGRATISNTGSMQHSTSFGSR